MRCAQNTLRFKRALQSEELPVEKLRYVLNRAPKFTDLNAKSRVKRMAESLSISIDVQSARWREANHTGQRSWHATGDVCTQKPAAHARSQSWQHPFMTLNGSGRSRLSPNRKYVPMFSKYKKSGSARCKSGRTRNVTPIASGGANGSTSHNAQGFTALPRAPVDKDRKRKQRMSDIKLELHRALLDNLNLAALEHATEAGFARRD